MDLENDDVQHAKHAKPELAAESSTACKAEQPARSKRKARAAAPASNLDNDASMQEGAGGSANNAQDEDDEVEFCGRSGLNALSDFPHAREKCALITPVLQTYSLSAYLLDHFSLLPSPSLSLSDTLHHILR